MIMGSFNKGGVESVIYNYYKFIDKTKFQFDFICFENSNAIPEKEILSMGGKIFIVPNIIHVFSYMKSLRKIFRKSKYEVVHSNISSLNIIPLFCAKKEGVKVRISHALSTSNKNELLRNVIKFILRKMQFDNANAFFYCSRLSGNWLFGKRKMKSNRAFFIPNAIDSTRFLKNEITKKEMRKKYHISDDAVVFGQICRMVTQKNVFFTIDIFRKFHEMNKKSYLFLVGEGPLRDKVENKIITLCLEDCVFLENNSTPPEDFYNLFDCFLLPSLYEGLPVVAIESQFESLPIICSKNITNEVKLTDYVIFERKTFDKDERYSLMKNAIQSGTKFKNENDLIIYEVKNSVKRLEDIYCQLIMGKIC